MSLFNLFCYFFFLYYLNVCKFICSMQIQFMKIAHEQQEMSFATSRKADCETTISHCYCENTVKTLNIYFSSYEAGSMTIWTGHFERRQQVLVV